MNGYTFRLWAIGAFLTLLVQVGWWISDPEGYTRRFTDKTTGKRIGVLLFLCYAWPAVWIGEALVMWLQGRNYYARVP